MLGAAKDKVFDYALDKIGVFDKLEQAERYKFDAAYTDHLQELSKLNECA